MCWNMEHVMMQRDAWNPKTSSSGVLHCDGRGDMGVTAQSWIAITALQKLLPAFTRWIARIQTPGGRQDYG